MRWVLRILAAAAVLAAGLGNAQQQAPRFALVVGNAAYTTPGWQLVNPVNDATLIGARLRALGFQVTPLNNATKAQLEAAMASFIGRLRSGGEEAVGVFYYAGHAAEHDGANLLVPVDVSASSMDELRYQAPPLNFVLRDMARAGNKVNIVILDACRNLPLPAGTRAGPAGGLSAFDDVPTNVLLAYATRAGATAPDNPSESNSVFTRTLAEVLANNAADPLSLLFETVQANVAAATGYSQRPEFRNQLLRAPRFSLVAPTLVTVATNDSLLRRAEQAERRVAELESQLRRQGKGAGTSTSAPPPVACPTSQFVLYFNWDRSNLDQASLETIDAAVNQAKACNIEGVMVVGHSDTAGSAAYSVGISQMRAAVVRDALVARGIDASLITTDGKGETELAFATADGVREPLNRRTAVTMTFRP